MATVKKHYRPRMIEPARAEAAEAASTTGSQRRRWRWWIALAVLPLAAWLLPSIVAHTPLLHWALARGTARLNGTVHVQSASLGWFSPVTASGIEVFDARKQTLLQAVSIRSERSLLGLLCNLSSPGKFRLESPKLAVALRNDGSNIEDLLAQYMAGESSGKVGFALDIVDGSVTVTDQETQQTWQIEKLQLALSMSREPGGPLNLETSAEFPDAARPGRLALKGAMQSGDEGGWSLDAEAVPLAMLQRLAARFAPETRLDGRLSSKAEVQWGGSGDMTIQFDASTDGFLLGMPALGKDQLRLDRLRTACHGVWRDRRLEIQQSSVDCDAGTIELTGALDLDKGTSDLAQVLLRQTFELQGRIDLARLARLLPDTLRIRQGTQITSGQVDVMASSRPGPSDPASREGPEPGMAWQAQLDVGRLTALDQGRSIAWDKPIQLVLAAHETPAGPVVDQLRCVSDFLNVQAAGTPDKLAASLSFNLQQLADQLGRFIDLGGMTLAGEGWGNLSWGRAEQGENSPDAAQKQTLAGEVQVRKFQLAIPGRQPWVENEIALLLSVQGGANLWTDRRVEAAELHVKAGADQLDVKLLQPVVDAQGAWPLDVQLQGQLQHWPPRLRGFVALDAWQFAGPFQLAGRVSVTPDAVTVQEARCHVAPLTVAGSWLNVNEPAAELRASGTWDFARRRCQIQSAVLTTATLSAQAGDLALSMPEDAPWQLLGTVEYRGDLARLRQWFLDSTQPPTWRMSGELAGNAVLQPAAGQIQGRVEADVRNFAVASSSGQFKEPKLHLTAQGNYEPQAGILRLEQCELTSDMLTAKAAGQMTQKQDAMEAQLAGEIGYDWEKLTALMRPWTGNWLQIAGRGTSPASYRGPFVLAGGQGAAGVRWDSARLFGFPLGPGELKTRLADGMLRAEPLNMTCSQGKLSLTPSLRLSPEPMELTLPRGPLAQRVQIDSGMCQAALKYVAPVLADVAAVSGAFSIELDGCRVPLFEPAKGDLAGRFIIHTVEVGPGPLVREMALLLNRASAARLKRESVVPFRMVQGRVYHQNLELEFPDLTIRTYGSAGLDQTLALIMEMPVPPKWIGNNPLGDALKNKVIKLPLGGTLSQPRIDQQELARVSREIVGETARNVLQNEVGKQLDRLLGPAK